MAVCLINFNPGKNKKINIGLINIFLFTFSEQNLNVIISRGKLKRAVKRIKKALKLNFSALI